VSRQNYIDLTRMGRTEEVNMSLAVVIDFYVDPASDKTPEMHKVL
jgi:hypothetical protein